jgi:nucleotide-binding universal stress UspA family protein
MNRLIVGTSGSPGSLQALRYGEVMARAHHAVLVPVIAWELPGGGRGQRMGPSGELKQACRDLAGQRLRGPAGWVLVNLACRPGDVLVVGAGRRGALARLAYSAVSRYCLAHARCPVIAIPPPALARELGHGRLAWVVWQRPLTPEKILRDQGKPAAS